MTLTKEEFEASYAVQNGLLIAQLPQMGIEAVPCCCGKPECRGWRIMPTPRSVFLDRYLNNYADRSTC